MKKSERIKEAMEYLAINRKVYNEKRNFEEGFFYKDHPAYGDAPAFLHTQAHRRLKEEYNKRISHLNESYEKLHEEYKYKIKYLNDAHEREWEAYYQKVAELNKEFQIQLNELENND